MNFLFPSNFISVALNLNFPFEVVLAKIYIEFGLGCFSSYTFYFNVNF